MMMSSICKTVDGCLFIVMYLGIASLIGASNDLDRIFSSILVLMSLLNIRVKFKIYLSSPDAEFVSRSKKILKRG